MVGCLGGPGASTDGQPVLRPSTAPTAGNPLNPAMNPHTRLLQNSAVTLSLLFTKLNYIDDDDDDVYFSVPGNSYNPPWKVLGNFKRDGGGGGGVVTNTN